MSPSYRQRIRLPAWWLVEPAPAPDHAHVVASFRASSAEEAAAMFKRCGLAVELPRAIVREGTLYRGGRRVR